MLWVHHCIIAAGIYTDIYCRRLRGVDRGGGDVSGLWRGTMRDGWTNVPAQLLTSHYQELLFSLTDGY